MKPENVPEMKISNQKCPHAAHGNHVYALSLNFDRECIHCGQKQSEEFPEKEST
jgi:hypothetical protein